MPLGKIISGVSSALSWAKGGLSSLSSLFGGGGGLGDVLSIGGSLFGIFHGYRTNEEAESAQKAELAAIRKASGIQTERDVTDTRRARRRAIASINARAGAAGVNPDWGSPALVREEAGRLYDQSISRLLEDQALREQSLTLTQAHISRMTTLNNQATTVNGVGKILQRLI